MKLAVLNPNTAATMTQAVVRQVQSLVPAHIDVVGWTATDGPSVIDSRESYAAGAHAAVETLQSHGADVDGVLLACFGDPGLNALRRRCVKPVVGLAEAALRRAAAMRKPFGIVTAGPHWVSMLDEIVVGTESAAFYRGTWALSFNGAAFAAEPERYLPAVVDCIAAARKAGVEAVILGGAGFSGVEIPVPEGVQLIQPVVCAVEAFLVFAHAPPAARPLL